MCKIERCLLTDQLLEIAIGQALVESHHAQLGRGLDDRGDLVRARLTDQIANGRTDHHDLGDRHPARAVQPRRQGLGHHTLQTVGKLVAERSISKQVSQVVFDRGGYIYHGKVAALADAARSGGLKF